MSGRSRLTREDLLRRVRGVEESLRGNAPRFVFVGGVLGAVYPLPEFLSVRPTADIDVVVDGIPVHGFPALEDRLRRAGFHNVAHDAPRCRWRPPAALLVDDTFTVDIVGPEESVEGVSNAWYAEAMRHAERFDLPGGGTIWAITPVYFVATKLEAHKSRGQGMPIYESHDMEDIVTVLAAFEMVRQDITTRSDVLGSYLRDELRRLRSEIEADIASLLDGGAKAQAMGPVIVRWLEGLG